MPRWPDWRGSSGSLWASSGADSSFELDRIESDGGGHREQGRSRRKGLRKRFRSLTEGLASFITGDKKEKEVPKHQNFVAFKHGPKDFEYNTSGYCSDYGPDFRTSNRKNNSYITLTPVTNRSPAPWKNPFQNEGDGNLNNKNNVSKNNLRNGSLNFNNIADSSKDNKNALKAWKGKSPPSPPPRRYSLWALDAYYQNFLPEPGKAFSSSYHRPGYITAPPEITSPQPPPPLRFHPLSSPVSNGVGVGTTTSFPWVKAPPSPSLRRSLSTTRRSVTPTRQRATTPTSTSCKTYLATTTTTYRTILPRGSSSPSRAATPPSTGVATPLGSPVLRGRSLSDSHSSDVRGSSEPRSGRTSRAEWYRRKASNASNARRRAQSPVHGSGCVVSRNVAVVLEKEGGSFGFTVRGGNVASDPSKCRPLVITHVRPGGPADREGTVKAGDRLIAVDGRDLTRCSLTDAQDALRRVERAATLTIEYDVSVMDSVRSSGGPLLVEIERAPGTSLGITLTHAHPDPSTILIETVRTASIAERCGALAVGDTVAAIDGTRLSQLTVPEAAQLLKTAPGNHVTLEIIPGPGAQGRLTFRKGGGVSFPHLYGSGVSGGYGSSNSGVSGGGGGGGGGGSSYLSAGGSTYNTLTSQRPRSAAQRRVQRRNRANDRTETASVSSHTTTGSGGGVGVSHPECLTVTLVIEGRGYGVVLRPPPHPADPETSHPLVAAIDPGGPADKSCIISPGDRLLGVNGRSVSGMGVSEVTQMIANSRPTVTLDIEFDVADSVVPSSGTFAVKLAKRQNSLGITLTAGKSRHAGEPVLISEVVRGSPAHRSGTLQPGDRLLAIDSTRLDHLTLDDARALLHHADHIVTLRVQKDDSFSEECSALVVYTVELVRHGGALGITISGSEEPFDPIFIAGLSPGGLADRTGAIHIGDRLLAINGHSLRGKPLSEAILMLQNSGDTVTLKISRPRDSGVHSGELAREDWLGRFGPAIPSVDSAVESWDSSALDAHHGSTPAHSKRDSGSDIVFRSDCGSTVRRRGVGEGKGDSGSGEGSNGGSGGGGAGSNGGGGSGEDDHRDTWGSPSPQPSNDSGQSEDKTDWDRMIADLNQISESCGLRERSHSPGNYNNEHTGTVIQRKKGPLSNPVVTSESLIGDNSSSTLTNKSRRGGISTTATSATSNGGSTTTTTNVTTPSTLASSSVALQQQNPDEEHEEGAYSVSKAALSYTGTYVRATSPTGSSGPIEVHDVTLLKDRVYEDFGFSVSDGLYEKGVYVNRVRKGGPADRSNCLRPYDRILQVNDTHTHDFDCCLTVPLIAAAGDTLKLVIARNPYAATVLDLPPGVEAPSWRPCSPEKHREDDIEEEEEEEEDGEGGGDWGDDGGERGEVEIGEGSGNFGHIPCYTPIPTIMKAL